ncbi:hypothetical protein RUM43_013792 [Polyplax serrata]|uniref:Uncharacterized protein n=1 Tax=Polyplax serrata TaxID=468196 RepID=A0AAN8PGY4_POLSC
MMSVPAINTLPPSGNQPSKINSSPTGNASVNPIGITVPPKLSVIPPPQVPAAQNKPQIGVNHTSVPLSLVYENKVAGPPVQPPVAKSSPEKPKDLSPTKPTSNGVETSNTKPPPSQTPQSPSASSVQVSKTEEASVQPPVTNHSEKKITSSNEHPVPTEQPPATTSVPPQNMTTAKVEESASQNNPTSEGSTELKPNNEAQLPATSEDSTAEAKPEKTDGKSATASQPSKRKREQKPVETKDEPEPEKKPRRIRSQVLPYQSPLPELATFINKSLKEKEATQKTNEEKLIVFYRNEFLAVRNAEGGFYLCQTLQNVFRTSHRIRIRWLSQEKEKATEDGDIYTPDFYDLTDFECILTTVALDRTDKNMYKLPKVELERIKNILKRALDVEKGVTEKPSITEEHPDGIDLSLYKDESQLQKPKKAAKRSAPASVTRNPKQVKKDGTNEGEKSPKKAKPKSRSKAPKKVVKTVADKGKTKKASGGKSGSKNTDQLKVSPPNEKARVVAKVLRKVDIASGKDVSKKQAKAKATRRSNDGAKKGKKAAVAKGGKKASAKTGGKEESHHERRQVKSKHSNKKN